jgi:hypothetical protein
VFWQVVVTGPACGCGPLRAPTCQVPTFWFWFWFWFGFGPGPDGPHGFTRFGPTPERGTRLWVRFTRVQVRSGPKF